MRNARRLAGSGALAALCISSFVSSGCKQTDEPVDCGAELDQVTFSVQAGAVQPGGSVTIYGAIQFGDPEAGAELTVHAVEVAGQAVALGPNNFNFRTWSISLSRDILVANAEGTMQATIPVVAYLYGGCVAHLPMSQEPVVMIPASDGGLDGATDGAAAMDGAAPVDAAADGTTPASDAAGG
jgi:hypothetical protein